LSESTSPAVVPAVILFGSPGSGKGTQAKLLRRCLGSPHISTGDMLRTHIAAHDAIGIESEALIKSGRLVPDELVNEIVRERLGEPDARCGVILDGYPRTLQQARFLIQFAAARGMALAVIHLVVDYGKIVARLSGRRQCPVCGTLYNLLTNPPKVAGICDRDRATLITREDDGESVIWERLREYELQTRPLLEFFRQAGVPTFDIGGANATPEEISSEICDSLRTVGVMGRVVTGALPSA
jgi:adenylate kinase